MSSIEFKKNVSVIDKYDVIVAGGGPAGCAAAAAAARRGAKTLLIEATGFLGGMGTGGMVPAWCPFSDGENIVYRGIALEVFEKAKSHVKHIPKKALDWVTIEPESLKIVYDDLVVESGADILFNTMVLDVVTDGESVTELICGNKGGITAYRAKSYIDCTGDADIAVRAGAEYTMGDEDGNLQSATLCCQLSNVNDYAYSLMRTLNGSDNPDSRVHEMFEDKELPLIDSVHMCSSLVGPSTVGFNSMHLDVDGTNPESISKGLILGRKKAHEIQKGLAKYYPEAFGGAFVSATAPLMGVRESRIIDGEYTLTITDYAERRTFEDEICRNSYFLDVHSACSALESFKFIHYGKGESHGIPYRCLVPKKVSNVIVAGRTISCERAVQGSIRVMPVCLAMGEAAGYAAYIAARDGKAFKNVNVGEVREYLIKNGAYIK